VVPGGAAAGGGAERHARGRLVARVRGARDARAGGAGLFAAAGADIGLQRRADDGAQGLAAGGSAGQADLGGRAASAAARAFGVPAVDTNVRAADAGWVAALREAGLEAGAWGADHAPTIRKALELGLDAFATDDPLLALKLRASAG
jgi:glycerophosphoryl diester phosphodiesterase